MHSLAAMYLVLLTLWTVLASPVILAFLLLARSLRRRSVRSVRAIVSLALAFSLLAAPIPTPIITVLVPHGLMLLDPTYYAYILEGPAMFAGLWRWIIPSLLLTFLVALAGAWWYIRSPGTPVRPTLLRG